MRLRSDGSGRSQESACPESIESMDDKRTLLMHFLGTLAYRTQKALRDAPADFGQFRAADAVRTPSELVRHMTSVLGYARACYVGGTYGPDDLAALEDEVSRFHGMLQDLGHHIDAGTELRDGMTPERLLQGPLADAMTHAGQLAMLRRLAGSPVRPEDFSLADIQGTRLGPDQADPVSPDDDRPEAPTQRIQIAIRPATPADWPAIVHINDSAFEGPGESALIRGARTIESPGHLVAGACGWRTGRSRLLQSCQHSICRGAYSRGGACPDGRFPTVPAPGHRIAAGRGGPESMR